MQGIENYVEPQSLATVADFQLGFSTIVWAAEIATEYQDLLTVGKYLHTLTFIGLCPAAVLKVPLPFAVKKWAATLDKVRFLPSKRALRL